MINLVSKIFRSPNAQQPVSVNLPGAGVTLRFRFGNAQHQGDRLEQQDAFGYSSLADSDRVSRQGFLAVLADGMGGLSDGQLTSSLTVSTMLDLFDSQSGACPLPCHLDAMAAAVNDRVCAANAAGRKRTGSTLLATLFDKSRLYCVSAGDSHLYVFREECLYLFTEDHNLQNDLLDRHMYGKMPMTEVQNQVNGQSLTSYIGQTGRFRLDCSRRGFTIQSGDKFLLCSDGVYQALSRAEMAESLKLQPQQAAESLIHAVVRRRIPGQDNATAMVIEYMAPIADEVNKKYIR